MATQYYKPNVDRDIDLMKINGTSQTARDWSDDLQHLANLAIIAFDTEKLDVDLSTLASEITADAIKTAVQSIAAEDFATEATLAGASTKIDTVNTNLGNIETDIELTNTKLDAANTSLDNIEADVAGAATETTLLSVDSKLDDLATRATEATLAAAEAHLGGIETDTGDIASDTGEIRTKLGRFLDYHTYQTPTNASVGTSSTQILASNANRKMAVIVNDSDTDIYLAVGNPAVVGSGIRINANGGAVQFGGSGGLILTAQAINGINGAGNKNVTVQEVE